MEDSWNAQIAVKITDVFTHSRLSNILMLASLSLDLPF